MCSTLQIIMFNHLLNEKQFMRRKCDLSCACLHKYKNLYPPIKTETKSNENEGAKFI